MDKLYNKDNMDFDIVICVGVKDLFIVKKTIRQIRRGGIITQGCIYLIVNQKYHKYYSNRFKTKYNVVLLDENSILPGLTFDTVSRLVKQHFSKPMRSGWYFQQFLKMAFSGSQYVKEYYLVWDADTLPTTPLTFFEGGKVLLTEKSEYHHPYFDTMERLVGLSKTAKFSFIAEHMMFNTNYMRELLNEIMKSKEVGTTWWEKIINAISPSEILGFSEFETYGTYVITKHQQTIVTRKLHTMRRAGKLFGRCIKQKEIDEFNGVTDTISVEATHIPPFPRNILQYAQLLFLYMIK